VAELCGVIQAAARLAVFRIVVANVVPPSALGSASATGRAVSPYSTVLRTLV
jgi:hypothetical protein